MQIKMYSKDNCPQCDSAFFWLKQQGLTMERVKLGLDFNTEQLFSIFPQAKSYPLFELNDQAVGNFDQLKQHIAFETTAEF